MKKQQLLRHKCLEITRKKNGIFQRHDILNKFFVYFYMSVYLLTRKREDELAIHFIFNFAIIFMVYFYYYG